MVAADEFHFPLGDSPVGVIGADEEIILYLKTVFLPASRVVDHVQQSEVAVGTIRKLDFVHLFSSGVPCNFGILPITGSRLSRATRPIGMDGFDNG